MYMARKKLSVLALFILIIVQCSFALAEHESGYSIPVQHTADGGSDFDTQGPYPNNIKDFSVVYKSDGAVRGIYFLDYLNILHTANVDEDWPLPPNTGQTVVEFNPVGIEVVTDARGNVYGIYAMAPTGTFHEILASGDYGKSIPSWTEWDIQPVQNIYDPNLMKDFEVVFDSNGNVRGAYQLDRLGVLHTPSMNANDSLPYQGRVAVGVVDNIEVVSSDNARVFGVYGQDRLGGFHELLSTGDDGRSIPSWTTWDVRPVYGISMVDFNIIEDRLGNVVGAYQLDSAGVLHTPVVDRDKELNIDNRLTIDMPNSIHKVDPVVTASGDVLGVYAVDRLGAIHTPIVTIVEGNSTAPTLQDIRAGSVRSSRNIQTGLSPGVVYSLGKSLIFEIASLPEHGELADFNPETGAIAYTANTGYTGQDSFLFRAYYVNDKGVRIYSNIVAMYINIVANAPPVVHDLTYDIRQGTEEITIDLSEGARDPEGDDFFFEIVSLPLYGTLDEFNAETGIVRYMPLTSRTYELYFEYWASDRNGYSNAGIVRIHQNHAPNMVIDEIEYEIEGSIGRVGDEGVIDAPIREDSVLEITSVFSALHSEFRDVTINGEIVGILNNSNGSLIIEGDTVIDYVGATVQQIAGVGELPPSHRISLTIDFSDLPEFVPGEYQLNLRVSGTDRYGVEVESRPFTFTITLVEDQEPIAPTLRSILTQPSLPAGPLYVGDTLTINGKGSQPDQVTGFATQVLIDAQFTKLGEDVEIVGGARHSGTGQNGNAQIFDSPPVTLRFLREGSYEIRFIVKNQDGVWMPAARFTQSVLLRPTEPVTSLAPEISSVFFFHPTSGNRAEVINGGSVRFNDDKDVFTIYVEGFDPEGNHADIALNIEGLTASGGVMGNPVAGETGKLWEIIWNAQRSNPGTHHLTITPRDSSGHSGAARDFYVNIVAAETEPFCGDGMVNGNEQCDDGNTQSGDGCSAQCTNEAVVVEDICAPNAYYACAPDGGYEGRKQCRPDGKGYLSCVATQSCSDGMVNGNEQCDDGNTQSGDGCSAQCENEQNGPPAQQLRAILTSPSASAGIHPGDAVSVRGRAEPPLDNDGVGGYRVAVYKADASGSWVFDNDAVDNIGSAPVRSQNGAPIWFDRNPTLRFNEIGTYQIRFSVHDTPLSETKAGKTPAWTNPATAVTIQVTERQETVSCIPGERYSCNPDNGQTGYKLCNDRGDGYLSCIPDSYCGNGQLESDEQCDDGNTFNGDGCSHLCAREESRPPVVSCTSGQQYACNPDGGYVGYKACNRRGDGYLNCITREYCSDGIVNGNEECDDGNTISGDSCSSDCRTESVPEPQQVCGNSQVESGEQCDNGQSNGIACTPGYGGTCNYCTSSCLTSTVTDTAYCSDGRVSGPEQCDDGNARNGDGCSAQCLIEQVPPPPANHAPVADSQARTIRQNQQIAITLQASDADGNALTYTIAGGPFAGSLSNFNGNHVTYTPTANFVGTDAFTFRAHDGRANSNAATVTIIVLRQNSGPVANSQSVAAPEDTPLAISLSGNDPDGDAITYSIITGPANGAISSFSASSGTLTYTPNANYNGSDAFQFTVSDGSANSLAATVSITIRPVNDAPVASAGTVAINEDQPVQFNLSARDADGDVLSFAITASPIRGQITSFNPATGALVYVPGRDFNGADSLQFTANDGVLVSAPAAIRLTVSPSADAPRILSHTPQSTAPRIGVGEEVLFSVQAADPDGDALSYSWALDGVVVATSAGGFTYKPGPDAAGKHSVIVRVFETGNPQIAASVTWDVTVRDEKLTNSQQAPRKSVGVASLNVGDRVVSPGQTGAVVRSVIENKRDFDIKDMKVTTVFHSFDDGRSSAQDTIEANSRKTYSNAFDVPDELYYDDGLVRITVNKDGKILRRKFVRLDVAE